MTAEASDYGGAPKVELEGEEGFGAESEGKDFKKGDGIASKERAESNADPIGGSFMIVNGDSVIVSEEDLDREAKVNLANRDALALSGEGNATPDVNEKAIVGEEVPADHVVGEGKGEEMEPPPSPDEESRREDVGPAANSETLLANSENKIDARNQEEEEKRPESDALLGNSENEADACNKEDEEKRPEPVTIAEGNEEAQVESAEKRELNEEQCKDKEAFNKEKKEEADEESLDKKVCSDVGEDHNTKVSTEDGVDDVRVESDSSIELGDNKEADSQVAVELEANLGNALKETGEEMELVSTVQEMEEPETQVAETDHLAESEVLDKIADLPESATPDVVTCATETDKQSEEGTALMAEESGPVCEDSEEQEESEFIAHVEEKQGSETLENKIEDQLVLNSSVEIEERTQLLEFDSQAQLESTTEGGKTNSEHMVIETTSPESHYFRQEESRSLSVVHHVSPDECSVESVTVPEVEVEKLLPTKDGSESLQSQEATPTNIGNESENSNLLNSGEEVNTFDDPNAKGSVAAGHSESIGSSKVSHSGQEELVREVSNNTVDKLVQEAAYDDKVSSETAADPLSAAGRPLPSGHDLDSEIVEEPAKSDTGGETLYIGSMKTVVSFAYNDTDQENKVHGSAVEADKDVAFHQIPTSVVESSSRNVMPATVKSTAPSIEGDESINKDNDEEPVHEEAGAVEEPQASQEDPNGWTTEGGKMDLVPKRQPCYIIKVPRFINDELWTRIQEAQIQLDEKTQSRDSIRVAIQKKKMVTSELWEKLEAARTDERAARSVQNAKRREINNLQSTMSKLKKATSIEEIDELIQSKEQSLQHETMSLKQEKLLIQEIKELKAQRKQLSSSMAPKAEIDEAFDHKDQIVERLGVLRKELESLGTDVSRVEANTKAAQKDYDDKQQELKVLQEKFKAADEVRQKAYGHWRDLKNESIRKSKYFFMYKDDIKTTAGYKTSGDNEALRNYCNKQVEKIMGLWNNNEDFRKHYMESNKNSTLRRLRTSDGRSLGPDEEPPMLQTVTKSSPLSLASPSEASKSSAPTVVSEAKAVNSASIENSFPALQAGQVSQPAKSNKTAKSAANEVVAATVSERSVEDDEAEKARKKEEEEKTRKEREREQEMRREMAAAEKERRRLEQKAKAKEAEERKKRLAQKAQARAESRAAKEAELRDKKRAKKEKKKAPVNGEAASGVSENNTVSSADITTPEIIHEDEVLAATPPRRSSRAAVALKQHNKAQPVPAALRNRGRRKMLRSWMWAILPCLLVLALFLAGNYISFSFGRIKFGN